VLVFDDEFPNGGPAQADQISNALRNDRHNTHLVTGVESGNMTSFFSTFANVAFRLGPLNGVVAN